ncbi:hypothetical protein COB11_00555 [Candidatus Aerophobetes bacterium]|uniref:Uncharacterized protein n=1 Tax=Aerophobetes bacterium TaxID=2030807 RepID=A0A2A4YMB0_UNCAE|nr:MAG: hypothetical protein COB11_00555 [Candidatus Aerophobetes bacterium]
MIYRICTTLLLLLLPLSTRCEEEPSSNIGHLVNFSEVHIVEFIKFVSKIGKRTFIFNVEELDFKVSYLSGKPTSPDSITAALKQILSQHNFKIKEESDYLIIEKLSDTEIQKKLGDLYPNTRKYLPHGRLSEYAEDYSKGKLVSQGGFYIYKLQYNEGSEILKVMKQLANSYKGLHDKEEFEHAITSLQWVESTNSLVFSADKNISNEVEELIKQLDKPQKQVFIEILVVEADAMEAQEFGLEWGAKGNIKDKLNLHVGNFGSRGSSPLAQALSSASDLLPGGKGFDLGVIGDLILHKGKTFVSLASLVSALQRDGKVQIVLNQKILTQDNKSSSIFVGDNIPFTGSVVSTVGAAQQTIANIEYRDVGVSLEITPLLGDSNIITLDIKEEITEARDDLRELESRSNGIQTTKTNMVTRVHVPDQHFLVLSGMVKNSKIRKKSGIPCLGGLPWIGAAFSKTKIESEKKSILVFVRPQIIHSFDTYDRITKEESKLFEKRTQISPDAAMQRTGYTEKETE